MMEFIIKDEIRERDKKGILLELENRFQSIEKRQENLKEQLEKFKIKLEKSILKE